MGQLESNLVGMFIAKFIGVFFVEQNYTKETISTFKFSSNFNAVFWKVHVHLYELLMGHINYFSILFKKLQNVA